MTTKEKMKIIREKRNKKNQQAKAERKNSYSGSSDPLWKDSIPVVKASEISDEITFRILPPAFETEDGHWAFAINIHYRIGVNNKAFICPKRTSQKPCPICEEIDSIEEPDNRKPLYPVYGALVYVIDRSKEDEGPKLFRMPFGLEQDILTQASRADILTIDDEDEGYDITVSYTKEKNQAWGKWGSASIARRESPISDNDDKMDGWLEFIDENAIDKIIKVYDYNKISDCFNGKEEIEKKEDTNPEGEVKNKMKSFRKR